MLNNTLIDNNSPETSPNHNQTLIPTTEAPNQNNNVLAKLGFLNNGIFLIGNTVAAAGNGLLLKNGILPISPAVCFIADGTIGAITSFTRIAMYIYDYKNETLETVLTWINLLQFLLLDAAVIQLNLPLPLNSELASVWGFFIPSAVIATLNSFIGIATFIKTRCCQSTLKKICNTFSSILPNIGVNLALTGVINMSKFYLNSIVDGSEKNKHNAELAFNITAGGIGIISLGLLMNTGTQLINNFCSSTTNTNQSRFDVESINNSSNDNEISTSPLINVR